MKRLWIGFAAVVLVSFSILGWIGGRIYQEMPPIPSRITDTNGQIVVADVGIARGQNVWQALGGMEVGSIWGHGSYVAPDWTADWLHREALFVLNEWARAEFRMRYENLAAEDQAKLRGRLTVRHPAECGNVAEERQVDADAENRRRAAPAISRTE